MLKNSLTTMGVCLVTTPCESIYAQLRTGSALPGFGGWVEVTLRADADDQESPKSQQTLMKLGRITQTLIRQAKGAPPWSIRTSGPFWNRNPSPGAGSFLMTLILPETDNRLPTRLLDELGNLGIPAGADPFRQDYSAERAFPKSQDSAGILCEAAQ